MTMEHRTPAIRELILQRIAWILEERYEDVAYDLSEDNLSAKLAFKADPQLNELRLALERMKRGEYGRCIFCKSMIAHGTLETNPTAHFCEQCTGILRYRTAADSVMGASISAKNASSFPRNTTSISG